MKIKLGTRKSALAMVQSELVKEALEKHGVQVELVPMFTPGDRKQGTSLAAKGDKRDWIEDLEAALLKGEIDIAVHSAKDVPRDISPETMLIAVLKRADPRDIFIGKLKNGSRMKFDELQPGAVIGTASLRRKAELLRGKPELKVVPHRGNVPTRLEKLDNSEEFSGIILAGAGVMRLNFKDLNFEYIPTDIMLPALNQGIIAVQMRKSDNSLRSTIQKITDRETTVAFLAERGCIEIVPADCSSAIGIHATVQNEMVTISARVLSHNGHDSISSQCEGPVEEAFELGQELGDLLIEMGAMAILDESRPTDFSS